MGVHYQYADWSWQVGKLGLNNSTTVPFPPPPPHPRKKKYLFSTRTLVYLEYQIFAHRRTWHIKTKKISEGFELEKQENETCSGSTNPVDSVCAHRKTCRIRGINIRSLLMGELILLIVVTSFFFAEEKASESQTGIEPLTFWLPVRRSESTITVF